MHHVTAEPAASPAAASQPTESPDQELIRALLGSNFVAEPQYIDEASIDGGFAGRQILVKYGTKYWYMADVQCRKDDAEDGDRFHVIYSDTRWGEVVLSAELYWDVNSPGKARQWSWLLLSEAALSNHGSDVHEVGSQKRGRKQTVRNAPSVGPTCSATGTTLRRQTASQSGSLRCCGGCCDMAPSAGAGGRTAAASGQLPLVSDARARGDFFKEGVISFSADR